MAKKIRTYMINDVQTELNRLHCKYDMVFHINGRKCKTVEQLFAEFKSVLKFPEYFSSNWDGLDELINDMRWVCAPEKGFVIFVTDADKILQGDEENFERLMRILISVPKEWQRINKKNCKIMFHIGRDIERFKKLNNDSIQF